MINYSDFKGKLIKMNKSYPIYDDNDDMIGYTQPGDMAVITFAEIKKETKYKKVVDISDELTIGIPFNMSKEEGYFETVIVSGDFIGVNSLALNLSDIAEHSVFLFNKIDDKGMITISDRKINYEYV